MAASPETEKTEKKTPGKNGGARPGAGRKPRGPGKVPFDLKVAAREYTDAALQTLAAIAQDDEAPPAARVAASNALLDRGHGKPTQTIEGTGEGGVIEVRLRR
jgi:hypothetical protein